MSLLVRRRHSLLARLGSPIAQCDTFKPASVETLLGIFRSDCFVLCTEMDILNSLCLHLHDRHAQRKVLQSNMLLVQLKYSHGQSEIILSFLRPRFQTHGPLRCSSNMRELYRVSLIIVPCACQAARKALHPPSE
jgi:hypothetical protein